MVAQEAHQVAIHRVMRGTRVLADMRVRVVRSASERMRFGYMRFLAGRALVEEKARVKGVGGLKRS